MIKYGNVKAAIYLQRYKYSFIQSSREKITASDYYNDNGKEMGDYARETLPDA
ncbi:6896_t:CDS:2 [Acaulospora colombiana]|uniref:6896_t:CDS:1 n=1 Tax=Acaulospora colombiana TaxID=27376 RepID=A0ACA9LCP1_9GLOM|nr:6896_t:CDS:2 [Acaulospora colombiana]